MKGCVACNNLWPWPISSRSFGLGLENRVRSIASTVLDRFFPYLVQMISSMRCVACDNLWPWPISSRSFDFENRVRSVMFSVLDRLFPYLPQIITTIRGCVEGAGGHPRRWHRLICLVPPHLSDGHWWMHYHSSRGVPAGSMWLEMGQVVINLMMWNWKVLPFGQSSRPQRSCARLHHVEICQSWRSSGLIDITLVLVLGRTQRRVKLGCTGIHISMNIITTMHGSHLLTPLLHETDSVQRWFLHLIEPIIHVLEVLIFCPPATSDNWGPCTTHCLRGHLGMCSIGPKHPLPWQKTYNIL